MIIVLKNDISSREKDDVIKVLKCRGYIVKEIKGENDTVLGAVGKAVIDKREIELMPGVLNVIPISKPYKLASRELKKEDTIVKVKNVKIGGSGFVMIAGPCAVESREQILTIAKEVKEAGAVILRGGAYKPRTSPYSFQGLGEEGLKYLKEAGELYGLPVTSEVVSIKDIKVMADYIDMFQIGARNMQNFELLKAVGATGMPVLLKRGLSATIEEWLMSAEYLMASGTEKVVLCERGIRTYEKATRNTLDCSAIPVIQKLTHLPIIGDPSHATGMRDMVAPMALALAASGASGLIIEVHNHPEKALSDGPQSLYPKQYEKLVRDIQALCPVIGKSLERTPRIIPASIDQNVVHTGSEVIAFQGERGAYSELATRRIFGQDEKVLACAEFKDVFEKVNKGEAKFGVLPIENTLGGTIFDNIDLFQNYDSIKVVKECQIRIIHNLIVNPGTKLEDITDVYSHPQGLAQCKDFFESKMPNVKLHSYFDTAGSVAMIKNENKVTSAAIAGAPAASYYSMDVLLEGIETNPKNYTRFYVIARDENADEFKNVEKANLASILFSVADKAGALFEILTILNNAGYNMKKLESRPILGKPWEYSFFLEVEIDDNYQDTFNLIKDKTASFKFLGTFNSTR